MASASLRRLTEPSGFCTSCVPMNGAPSCRRPKKISFIGRGRSARPPVPEAEALRMALPDYPFYEIDPLMKLNIWAKGVPVEGYDPAMHRLDICGNWIQFDQHALESDYG